MDKTIFACLRTTDPSVYSLFRPFDLKMEEAGMPAIVINVFKCYFGQILYGAQGKLTEHEIRPVKEGELKSYDDLASYTQAGREAIPKAVVIKLNGGLGTSMGLEKAKSLITVKDGYSFLSLILSQMLHLRKKHRIHLPLCFMNSFKTHMDTMLQVDRFSNSPTDIPLAFVQHRYPKIVESDFTPASWPSNPELEWNPPGHGDIYTALVTSGLLDRLLKRGYTYAFVSNSDNLGAIMDERILGYMAKEKLPFVMEVARRTPSDSKGGHLARLVKNGRLVLRELAMCPDPELQCFGDIKLHRYFNTNSIWMDLREVERVFINNHMMPLDIIINPKTLDPRDHNSPRVLQVETAMGSAVTAFEKATAIEVPRSRFAPVKTTNDLCVVMSDCCIRTPEDTITPNPVRVGDLPKVTLDGKFYKKIDDFAARFPQGAPSLLECESLTVHGDFLFHDHVTCLGKIKLTNKTGQQVVIASGTTLQGDMVFE